MEGKQKLWMDYRLYLTVLAVTVLSEKIGIVKIPLGPGAVTLLPLIYAMIIALVLFLIKPVRFLKEPQSETAGSLISIGITLLIAKMSITSGVAIKDIITAGPALILQNFGNLGTILFALPVALLLGFKRECIGMTHSVGREPNVALIAERYGSETPEFRGVMIVYVVGTVFGTIFMGAIASFLASATPISVEAYAMATGCGSAGMMTAALAPLIEMKPEMEQTLTAFASISNLISTVGGLYISIFLGLPITEKLYGFLEPRLSRKKKTEIVCEERG